MGVAYHPDLRTDRMKLVLGRLGTAGAPTIPTTGTATGTLVIGTSALSGATGVLLTFDLQQTPGEVSGDVLTLTGLPLSAYASATGTAAKAELRADDGTVVVGELAVGTSGTNILISGTDLVSGQVYHLTGATITHPTT